MAKELYLALDISTSKIGLCLFSSDKKLLRINHILLKNTKIDSDYRYLLKADTFREYIKQYKEESEKQYNCKITNIIIEDPLGSSNNINTAMLLAKFNGVCSYILYEMFGFMPIHITVHNIRKSFCKEFLQYKNKKEVLSFPKNIDKKLYIWEKVSKLHPEVEWIFNKNGELKEENFDMSDSVAVMYAYFDIYKPKQ